VVSDDDNEELQARRSPQGSTQLLRSRGRDIFGQTHLLLAYKGEYVSLCTHIVRHQGIEPNQIKSNQIKSNQIKFILQYGSTNSALKQVAMVSLQRILRQTSELQNI